MIHYGIHKNSLLFAEDLYQYDFHSSNIRLNELLSRCMKNLYIIVFFLKGWVPTKSYTRSSCGWVLTQFCKTYHINFTDSFFENFYIIILIFENWFIKFTYWIQFESTSVDQTLTKILSMDSLINFKFVLIWYHTFITSTSRNALIYKEV